MTDSGHSSYYRAFIRSALRGYVISSGYERLDDLLGGGFGPGLYLLSGHRPAMRRAFLDNLVWGAVEQERSIWYYALDTSTQSVWERLIVTFGSLLGEPVLPEELRASTGVDDVAARVGRIDAALVTNVFPHVRLRGMVGLDWGNSHRFLAGLDARLCAEDSPRMLAIDSLFQLFPLRGGDTVQEARLVGELDRILRARSAAAVATVPANPDARLLSAVRGHVRLSVFGDSDDGPSRNVLVTARLEDGVKSDVFSVDGVTGLLG